MRKVFFGLFFFFQLSGAFSQDSLGLKLDVKQDNGLLLLEFTNHSSDTIYFSRCFDFQTVGEYGNPDITMFIKKDINDDFSAPIASRYTRINRDCYIMLVENESFFLEIQLKSYFRNGANFLSEISSYYFVVRTILIKDRKVIPNYIIESPVLKLDEFCF